MSSPTPATKPNTATPRYEAPNRQMNPAAAHQMHIPASLLCEKFSAPTATRMIPPTRYAAPIYKSHCRDKLGADEGALSCEREIDDALHKILAHKHNAQNAVDGRIDQLPVENHEDYGDYDRWVFKHADGCVGVVAHGAVQNHRVMRYLHHLLGGEGFVHERKARALFKAVLIPQARGRVDGRLADADDRPHIDEAMGHFLQLVQRASEIGTLARVLHGQIEGGLADGEGHERPVIEAQGRPHVDLLFAAAQHVLFGNANVVQKNGAPILRVGNQALLLAAEFNARHVFFDNEGATLGYVAESDAALLYCGERSFHCVREQRRHLGVACVGETEMNIRQVGHYIDACDVVVLGELLA